MGSVWGSKIGSRAAKARTGDAEKAWEGASKGDSGGCGSMGCRGCSRDGVLVESEGEGWNGYDE
jgi:hypothetical protein